MSHSAFQLARLRAGLRPVRLHWFPRLRSTNDQAATMRRRGDLFAPAVVLTGRQIAGRGRGANTWWSRPGCLTATFAFPVDDHAQPHQLPLIAGLAVRQAVAEVTGSPDVQLKWPNDLLHDSRKLAGLLCERVDGVDLVGLGMNVNLAPRSAPPTLRDRLTSLSQIAGHSLDMTDVLTTIANHLHRAISGAAQRPFVEILREYDTHHALIGRHIKVVVPSQPAPLTGRCEGLDDIGRLLLRSRSTLHHVISGQVLV